MFNFGLMFSIDIIQKQRLYTYLTELITPQKLTKIENLAKNRSQFIVPVIEDIYQFRNAGAIIRSMEAFAFQKLIALEKNNKFIPEGAVARGADKWITIQFMKSGRESLLEIKKAGYQLVAVSPEKQAVNLSDFEITKPLALIFGTEFEGVTQETLEIADECIKIPMYGFTESLNVSVAAGISFYEMRKKLENSNLEWKMTEEEMLDLKIKWAKASVSSGEEIAEHYLKNLIV